MGIKKKTEAFLAIFTEWAARQPHIKGAALVGSFARGDFHRDSDVDLTIISTDKAYTLQSIEHDLSYKKVKSISREEWGILTSLRVVYRNGLEIEYGVVTDEWIKLPLDEGTRNVATNSFRILMEKEGIFENINRYLKDI